MLRRIAWISLNALGGIVASVALFCLCAWGYSRHNAQPVYYHPDEGGKSAQVTEDVARNHNHPQLLLEVAAWVMRWEQTPADDRQAVTEAGRRASAYLAAGAVVLCAWAGFAATGGWFGFAMGAVGAGLCPALLTHAHFFKEDSALVFGVACVLCAGSVICAGRWHWAMLLPLALLLGAACGVAASGKYAGAIFLAPALLLVLVVTVGRWWVMPVLPLLVALGAVASWYTINYRAVQDWDRFVAGFSAEAEHSQSEHMGITMDKPNGYFADLVWSEAMPHVKVLACAAPLALLARRRRRGNRWPPAFGWWLIVAGGVYLTALSYSVIPFYRYAVPVTVMLYLLAALSVVWIVQVLVLPAVWRGAVAGALVAVVVMLQFNRCADYDRQFASDSRDNLRRWADRALPPFSRVVADWYASLRGMNHLPDPTATRLRVNSEFFAADAGTVDELRSRGVQYVVVASASYDRFFNAYTRPAPSDEERFHRRRNFYKTLFEKYPVLWEQKAEHSMQAFANPDVFVFRIGDQPPSQRNRN